MHSKFHCILHLEFCILLIVLFFSQAEKNQKAEGRCGNLSAEACREGGGEAELAALRQPPH